MFFRRLKIRFEHTMLKNSRKSCLPYLVRVDVYLTVVKFTTYTPYDLLHTVVCDVTNTQYQDFDRLSKGSIHHQTTYVHAYNDTVIVA